MRSTVKKAAKLAVYEDMRIKEKNHQAPPTIRPLNDRGVISVPCCMKAPNVNHKLFVTENELDTTVPQEEPKLPSIFHSWGEKRETRKRTMLTPI